MSRIANHSFRVSHTLGHAAWVLGLGLCEEIRQSRHGAFDLRCEGLPAGRRSAQSVMVGDASAGSVGSPV